MAAAQRELILLRALYVAQSPPKRCQFANDARARRKTLRPLPNQAVHHTVTVLGVAIDEKGETRPTR
jgi:hypothetical protein